MKFDISAIPEGDLSAAPRVGDVFPAQGGKPTVAWVVVSVRDERTVLLGVDKDGEICSAQTYNQIALEDRPRIGFCPQIADLTLAVRQTKIAHRRRT